MASKYTSQDRGSAEDYAKYYAGMNQSMRQKVALISSFLPTRGRVADMGCGSGQGSADLAGLYPQLEIVGVDINPKSVEYCREHYSQPNLSFEQGDIADRIFPNDALDGILNSSVLHHVTSFNEFDTKHIDRLLVNQMAALRQGGILAIRDFVVPENPEQLVWLELPTIDGDGGEGKFEKLSSVELFKEFIQGFRSSLNRDRPAEVLAEKQISQSVVAFKIPLRLAVEFVLRKDYRKDWETELLEEYLYFSQRDFEKSFENLGLRINISKPIYNPWIVNNRFVDQFSLKNEAGELLDFPATNYLIIGEKVSRKSPVSIVEVSREPIEDPAFLNVRHLRSKTSDRLWSVVERPNLTVDVLPYMNSDNGVQVLARQGYPRPLLSSQIRNQTYDRGYTSGYVLGPLNMIVNQDVARDTNQIKKIFCERFSINPEKIGPFIESLKYYPSPGGVAEEVNSFLVEISGYSESSDNFGLSSGPFKDSGVIKSLDASQTLRSFQVSGLFDGRLELNLIDLLLKNSLSMDWIGEEISQIPQCDRLNVCEFFLAEDRDFEEANENSDYLEVFRSKFRPYNPGVEISESVQLEHISVKDRSTNTVVVAPLTNHQGDIYLGVEAQSLPGAQLLSGNSEIFTAPAWRTNRELHKRRDYQLLVRGSLEEELNFKVNQLHELGGSYFSTLGCTVENVNCFVATGVEGDQSSLLRWIKLKDLIHDRRQIRDGHLMILVSRLAVALADRLN